MSIDSWCGQIGVFLKKLYLFNFGQKSLKSSFWACCRWCFTSSLLIFWAFWQIFLIIIDIWGLNQCEFCFFWNPWWYFIDKKNLGLHLSSPPLPQHNTNEVYLITPLKKVFIKESSLGIEILEKTLSSL